MTTRGWSFDHAVSVIKSARSVVQVNKGFEQQLRAFGAQKCDVYAAHQVVMRQRLRGLVDRRLALTMEHGNSKSSLAVATATNRVPRPIVETLTASGRQEGRRASAGHVVSGPGWTVGRVRWLAGSDCRHAY
jgi:hypothetical protein